MYGVFIKYNKNHDNKTIGENIYKERIKNMVAKNVLIFPAGTEIAFEIFNALKYSKFVNIIGGTSISDHSEYVFKTLIKDFPYVDDYGFLCYLNRVINEYKIEYIYPAHDSVGMFLSEHVGEIQAQVVISDYKTVKICRSKADTYEYFKNEYFIPRTYKNVSCVKEYPVFVKPSVGQGSQGARKINTYDELCQAVAEDETLVICEYLPGMEYTVDCFTDRYGKLRVVKLRDRERIRAGISVRSKELSVNNEIRDIANIINRKLKFRGAWFFQVKQKENKEYCLMEISPRVPGTMGLSRNTGVNFPLLTLFDFWEYDVDIVDNNYDIMLDRAFYNAYKIDISYGYIYIDYDDTLVIGQEVNILLLAFLYQAIKNKKKLILLSKHKGNIYDDMKKHRISKDLFDEIIVIAQEDEKVKHIKYTESIFIDDSFSERCKVKKQLNIPVFDVDMVEALIDWKL